jgi:hypothetical protein
MRTNWVRADSYWSMLGQSYLLLCQRWDTLNFFWSMLDNLNYFWSMLSHSQLLLVNAALQRKSHLCIPKKGIAQPYPNFYIHVSVRDLQIPRKAPNIFLQQNRQTDSGNICTV